MSLRWLADRQQDKDSWFRSWKGLLCLLCRREAARGVQVACKANAPPPHLPHPPGLFQPFVSDVDLSTKMLEIGMPTNEDAVCDTL